jgi:hypothetical protein
MSTEIIVKKIADGQLENNRVIILEGIGMKSEIEKK